MAFPENYWQTAKHIYFRDHDHNGAWGVLDGNDKVVLRGLDKSNAAAIALILNGDGYLATSLLIDNRRGVTEPSDYRIILGTSVSRIRDED